MDSQAQPNPHTTIADPFEEYQKNLDAYSKTHPELLETGRLAYELFLINEDGKKLLKKLEERFLMKSLVDPMLPSAPNVALYWAGYTDCIKALKALAIEHKQRIEAPKL